MKHICLIACIVILLISVICVATAETPEEITFRSIPWYSKLSDVDASVRSISGITIPWSPVNEGARIESWFQEYEYSYTDDSVENGGVILSYSNLSVAGYTASLKLSFLYSIMDGRVNYSKDDAEFYMAMYTIEGLTDMLSAYKDLRTKLYGVYGNYDLKNGYHMEGAKWTAKDGSIIWIRVRQNSISDNYEEIKIFYFAPNGIDRLATLAEQIKQEAIQAEEEERLRNQTNFEGL